MRLFEVEINRTHLQQNFFFFWPSWTCEALLIRISYKPSRVSLSRARTSLVLLTGVSFAVCCLRAGVVCLLLSFFLIPDFSIRHMSSLWSKLLDRWENRSKSIESDKRACCYSRISLVEASGSPESPLQIHRIRLESLLLFENLSCRSFWIAWIAAPNP